MKRLLLFCCVIFGIFSLLIYDRLHVENNRIVLSPIRVESVQSVTPTQPIETLPIIRLRDKNYTYASTVLTEKKRITLIANDMLKYTTEELREIHHCSTGINGNFYDTSGKPMGLFISNGKTLYSSINSALFNAFFWIYQGQSHITTDPPETADQAVQTGPQLIKDGNALTLQIRNDEEARRSVAAITTDNQLILLSIYDNQMVYNGPFLTDLPAAVAAIGKSMHVAWKDAINLDGGSASSFFNEQNTLAEIKPIGSLFCVY